MGQQKHETASLHAPESSAMETDGDHSIKTTPDILELIAELKQDIATIALKMQVKFNQTEILKSTNQPKCTSTT